MNPDQYSCNVVMSALMTVTLVPYLRIYHETGVLSLNSGSVIIFIKGEVHAHQLIAVGSSIHEIYEEFSLGEYYIESKLI